MMKRVLMATVVGVSALVGVLGGAGGCAVNRATLSREELEARHAAFLQASYEDRVRGRHTKLARWEYEWENYAQGKTSEEPVYDILILSGGGDYGAFGAGFLDGWGRCKDAAFKRPKFDDVTGVSTGALIAPFAFVGDEHAYMRCCHLYQQPEEDWIRLRGLLFFLPGHDSFMDTSGLQRHIREQIDEGLIRQIADAGKEYRTLSIGTTNLDIGVTQRWELVSESQKAIAKEDYERIHKILLASAAIPAVFPPVVIDNALYVDGGTTANILFSVDPPDEESPFSMWKKKFPDRPLPKTRIWVIINNQMSPAPSVVQPTWPSITGASVSTAIRSSTWWSMRYLTLLVEYARKVESMDVELRFVAIPDHWRPPVQGAFKKETMVSLAKLGAELGEQAGSWRAFSMDEGARKPEH